MKKINEYMCLAAAGLTVLLAGSSCGTKDNYEKGPETSPDCIAAYFPSSNQTNYTLTPEEYSASDILSLKVERAVSDAAASVPVIVVSKDDVFEVPSTVEFAAGESTSTLDIKMNGLEQRVNYTFTVRLGDEYVDHYSVQDGSDVFKGDIVIARWVKVVKNARFMYSGQKFPDTYSDIYNLDGYNKFYIENFLGSGVNLGFSIKSYDEEEKKFIAFNPSDRTTWKGTFIPLDHCMDDPDGGTWWWLMKDVANQEYASWTPEGSETGFNYINFYKDESTTDFASIDMNGSTDSTAGWLCSYGYLTDDSETGYVYVYMYWNSNDIPSEE